MLSLARGSLGVILESFLTGAPAVASATGGIIELVDDGYSEILISRFSGSYDYLRCEINQHRDAF